MPRLANVKRENFCRAFVRGSSKAAAYRDAGYADDRRNAARLTTFNDVRSRIEELRSRGVKRADITDDIIVAGLAKEATSSENSGAERNSAWKLLGQAIGLFAERPDAPQLTTEQIESVIAVVSRGNAEIARTIMESLPLAPSERKALEIKPNSG